MKALLRNSYPAEVFVSIKKKKKQRSRAQRKRDQQWTMADSSQVNNIVRAEPQLFVCRGWILHTYQMPSGPCLPLCRG